MPVTNLKAVPKADDRAALRAAIEHLREREMSVIDHEIIIAAARERVQRCEEQLEQATQAVEFARRQDVEAEAASICSRTPASSGYVKVARVKLTDAEDALSTSRAALAKLSTGDLRKLQDAVNVAHDQVCQQVNLLLTPLVNQLTDETIALTRQARDKAHALAMLIEEPATALLEKRYVGEAAAARERAARHASNSTRTREEWAEVAPIRDRYKALRASLNIDPDALIE